SAIFYHSDTQKQAAVTAKSTIPGAVTEIIPASQFYPAETYHQNYYNNNQNAPYCSLVISPKIKKLFEKFPQLLK
ncbi:MAG: peptide-methionine (S)-S-oxide reductase, partial [candidate division Zixibacteria bacterium]|nr:peptide-methionine (S)-S-oxide reductase [candidate division Zixibacteria bacterium]